MNFYILKLSFEYFELILYKTFFYFLLHLTSLNIDEIHLSPCLTKRSNSQPYFDGSAYSWRIEVSLISGNYFTTGLRKKEARNFNNPAINNLIM